MSTPLIIDVHGGDDITNATLAAFLVQALENSPFASIELRCAFPFVENEHVANLSVELLSEFPPVVVNSHTVLPVVYSSENVEEEPEPDSVEEPEPIEEEGKEELPVEEPSLDEEEETEVEVPEEEEESVVEPPQEEPETVEEGPEETGEPTEAHRSMLEYMRTHPVDHDTTVSLQGVGKVGMPRLLSGEEGVIDRLYVSLDGQLWYLVKLPFEVQLPERVYTEGSKFVTTATDWKKWYSSDGFEWTQG